MNSPQQTDVRATARKFVAATSREALRLVREALGADAIVLSHRVTAEGVEIVAMVEGEVQGVVQQGSAPAKPVAAPVVAAPVAAPAPVAHAMPMPPVPAPVAPVAAAAPIATPVPAPPTRCSKSCIPCAA